MEKVEIGRYYKNIYTGIICRVTGKIFYNIKFNDEGATHGLNPQYTHYKRFRKNWVEVPDKTQTRKEPSEEKRSEI